MSTLLQDIRFALHQMRKSPGFTLTAVLTLAVGIGGVVAAFSIVNAVLLRPLPYPQPNSLVVLHVGIGHIHGTTDLSVPILITYERDNRAFTNVGGYIGADYNLSGAGAPFRASAERITASLFRVLGVKPLIGRVFSENEDEDGARVTVLSYGFWKERFGSSPDVLGKTIELNRIPYTIIGVMPRNFETPLRLGKIDPRDFWVPMSFTPAEKAAVNSFGCGAVARLRPGVTMQQAQQDVKRVLDIMLKRFPQAHFTVSMTGLKEQTIKDARPVLRVLLVAVILILLIACANLANLLLARASRRKREFGVRMALGAGRWRMLRQLLTESLMLSVLGGVAGISLAVVLVRIAAGVLPSVAPELSGVHVIGAHWSLAALAVGLTAATGILCGLAPARLGAKPELADAIRAGGQNTGASRTQHRLQNVLVVAEATLATLLLVAAGLLLRSFTRMLEVQPGFQPQHVITASFALPNESYPTQQQVGEFLSTLQQHLQRIPGVEATGFATGIPVAGGGGFSLIAPQGYVRKPKESLALAADYSTVGNYFQALGIPLLRGRYFDAADQQPGAPLVTIISESVAKKYFSGEDPIGMHVKRGPSYQYPLPPMTIVGVVGNIRDNPFDQTQNPEIYEPASQVKQSWGPVAVNAGVIRDFSLVMRTQGAPKALIASMIKAVHQLDPLLPVFQIHTMNEVISATEAPRRFNTAMFIAFAGIALALALLGIYGVLTYAVTARRREIAIRMALGATRQTVILDTLRSALTFGVVGVVCGVLAAVGLTRFMSSMLYGVRPLDLESMIGAAGILLVCAALAGLLPARRAASVDPMLALRSE